jgi:hypothetical protein
MTNDDNLRTHIADLLSVLRERRCINDVLLQRAGHIRKPTRGDLSDLRRWAREYEPVARETASDLYKRLNRDARAILRLSDDEHLTAPVKKLKRLTTIDLKDLRGLISRAENVSDQRDGVKLAGRTFGVGLGAAVRNKQIEDPTAEVETYYLLRFSA